MPKNTYKTLIFQIIDVPITYINVEGIPVPFTETISYTLTSTVGVLSTHTTTIKCTPSATSSTSFFHLQATNVPSINGQYLWVAPVDTRILSFSIEWASTPKLDAASAFSLEPDGRMVSRHLNGTHYVNVDPYGNFQLVHMMERNEIQRRGYDYLRCSMKPASGKYASNYKELYCKADGGFNRQFWNYCPVYKELFNAPFVLADEFSPTAPPCSALVLLVKPICGWT